MTVYKMCNVTDERSPRLSSILYCSKVKLLAADGNAGIIATADHFVAAGKSSIKLLMCSHSMSACRCMYGYTYEMISAGRATKKSCV